MAATNLSAYDKNILPNAETFRFGIVVSKWNEKITSNLKKGCVDTLADLHVPPENIEIFEVPGSFELIYACNRLAKSNAYDAVIAIGNVIKGETPHFEYVCSAVAQGIKDINIQTDTPTIFCVLTDNFYLQSVERSGGRYGNKGVEAAVTAVQMANFKNKF